MLKYLYAPFLLMSDVIRLFIVYLPGPSGFRLRYLYYKRHFKRMGKNVSIDVGVLIDGAELISVGNNVYIDKYCVISTGTKLVGNVTKKKNPDFTALPGEIIFGDDIHVAQSCIFMGYGGITLGNRCVTSAGCKIYSLTNTPTDPKNIGNVVSIQPYTQAPFLLGPVVLNENVWLGLNVIVMPSVTVGMNSFCVSNSLILKTSPANSYLAGQPATRLRNRFQ